ncbi:MAG: hypothetical protein PHD87_00900 [Candidatus Cloacimonetes bacterium]|nr:hypothetical protein [Candidatus Cloacimonadota bacterium]
MDYKKVDKTEIQRHREKNIPTQRHRDMEKKIYLALTQSLFLCPSVLKKSLYAEIRSSGSKAQAGVTPFHPFTFSEHKPFPLFSFSPLLSVKKDIIWTDSLLKALASSAAPSR